nr:hypothetical protein [Mycobacterium lepraemurium]
MLERRDPVALVAVIESTHREESMRVARRFAAVAAGAAGAPGTAAAAGPGCYFCS